MYHLRLFPDLSATIPIDRETLDLETTRAFARAHGLSEKEDFHLTVIGRRTGEEIVRFLQTLHPEERETRLARFHELSASYHPEIAWGREYYSIRRDYTAPDDAVPDIRESVIELAEISGLEEFYRELFEIIPIPFDTPFPHITLYTTSTHPDKRLRGIGIYSEEDFRNMNPERIQKRTDR